MAVKEIKKDSIAFLMPCGGPVEPRVLQSAINLVTTAQVNGYTVRQVGITDRTLIHTARNFLSIGFLEHTDCEWAFWMDSDMILEARTLPIMMAWAKRLDAKMLTGIYYQRMGDHKPVLWKKQVRSLDGTIAHSTEDEYSHFFIYPKEMKGQPYPVDVAGFGCVLLHRDVLEAMKKPYFRFEFYKGDDGKEKEASEDFYFFVQAKKLGFQLWAVPELQCGHLGQAPTITHKDMVMDMSKMTEMDMSTAPKLLEVANGNR